MIVKFRIVGLLGIAALFLVGCSPENSKQTQVPSSKVELDSAEYVIGKSIEYHGGSFEGKQVNFDFRDMQYTAQFDSIGYMLRRQFTGDTVIVDSSFKNRTYRSINGVPTVLKAEKSAAYTNSINSVFYFALLPSKLSDDAVISEYQGRVRIDSSAYHKIAVSFKKEGGGEDYQDRFYYWFNAKNFRLEYFAYSYETNGGGIRFRVAEKEHKLLSGQVLMDYSNFKTDSLSTRLEDLLPLYADSALTFLSHIRLKNIVIKEVERH